SRDDAVTKGNPGRPTRRLTSSARSSLPIPGRGDLFCPVRDLPPQPVLAAVDYRSRVRQAAHFNPDRRAILWPAHTRLHAFVMSVYSISCCPVRPKAARNGAADVGLRDVVPDVQAGCCPTYLANSAVGSR